MKKRIIPPIIAICVLFFLVCIEVIAGNTHTKEELSVPLMTASAGISEGSNLNESEKMILNLLTNGVAVSDHLENIEDNKDYELYLKYLTVHFNTLGVELSATSAYEAVNKIIDLNRIINLEEESIYQNMSIDGRELAISLAEDIYELCGLNAIYNIHGDLVQILSESGDYLYIKENTVKQTGFQMDVLFITITVLMLLLGLCIIIAKKHQLFIKDGIYDGFNKEEFAR